MCEKAIYPNSKMDSFIRINAMKYSNDILTSFRNAVTVREIGLENILHHTPKQREFIELTKNYSSRNLEPTDYLHLIESHLPKELISPQNFIEIKALASNFSGNLTSFQIFESRLNSYKTKADYCFAISYKNEERETLLNLIKNNSLPKHLLEQSEWKQVGNFVKSWADQKSILYDNVLGIWFEFDTASSISDTPIPSIFIQPNSSYAISGDAASQHIWITKSALPLLLGRPLSKRVEKKVIECIKKLPLESSVFQVGTMLSRKDDEIRLVIKRIRIDQILPYLNSIGWIDDEKQGLTSLLEEIKNKATRIVLHISVGEKVNQKVGIECSFSPDRYHREQGWKNLLDYLREKDLCNQEKYSAILQFPGIEPQYQDEYFNSQKCIPSVMISEKTYSHALIRYISHIKLVYEHNKKIEAKAYSAVRLVGYPYEHINQETKLIKN